MIEYLHLPEKCCIMTNITKKMFAEKAQLTPTEKKLLKEDINYISMRGLLQPNTIGLSEFRDKDYDYDQIVIALVDIKTPQKREVIASMLQKAFPFPLLLVIHSIGNFCVSWAVKRINQADSAKRLVGEIKYTRWFTTGPIGSITQQWLKSLDITQMSVHNLKDLYECIASRLYMLSVADEAGRFIEADRQDVAISYHTLMNQLTANRNEQKDIRLKIKKESQFNERLQLSSRLKDLQNKESKIKKQIKENKV